ncbi:MAG: hypothetical protein NFCOHLIN_02067 [Gammaproteobacteria bacterium]|nr:hypothetical protein [Gammaproteobacteria bacterium]
MDLDFGRRVIVVREGRGARDRVVMMPLSMIDALREQLNYGRTLWELLGHSDVSTTMIHTHVLKVMSGTTISPLDRLGIAEKCARYDAAPHTLRVARQSGLVRHCPEALAGCRL